MDIFSMMIGSVPAYYVIVPLIVLVVMLLVLMMKKDDKQVIGQVVQSNVNQSSVNQSTQPSVAQVVTPSPQIPQINQLESQVSVNVTQQAPQAKVEETHISQASLTSVPPLSSWKPRETAVVTNENVGISESDMQKTVVTNVNSTVIDTPKEVEVSTQVAQTSLSQTEETLVNQNVANTAVTNQTENTQQITMQPSQENTSETKVA